MLCRTFLLCLIKVNSIAISIKNVIFFSFTFSSDETFQFNFFSFSFKAMPAFYVWRVKKEKINWKNLVFINCGTFCCWVFSFFLKKNEFFERKWEDLKVLLIWKIILKSACLMKEVEQFLWGIFYKINFENFILKALWNLWRLKIFCWFWLPKIVENVSTNYKITAKINLNNNGEIKFEIFVQ